jgi:hypothetical protein
MPSLSALSLAPAARDWLAATTSARVLSIFDRACNLINQDNAILALVTTERGLNPFAMVVAADERSLFQDVPADSEVSVEADCLTVGALQINFAGASLWNPIPDWPALRRVLAGKPSQLDDLAIMVMELAEDGSLLDLCLTPAPRSAGSSTFGAPSPDTHPERSSAKSKESVRRGGRGVRQPALLDRARRGAAELAQGLLDGSAAQCGAGAKVLAGLGSGLTPAGDDFMVGMMLSMWAGLYGEGREQFGPSIAEAAAPLTTTLSTAYLRAAARGECMSLWHTLFDAVLRADTRAMRAALNALMSIGHTSGADALAGFLAARYLAQA